MVDPLFISAISAFGGAILGKALEFGVFFIRDHRAAVDKEKKEYHTFGKQIGALEDQVAVLKTDHARMEEAHKSCTEKNESLEKQVIQLQAERDSMRREIAELKELITAMQQ